VPAGDVETILSFCHYELNDTSLEGLLPYFTAKGIGVINASPTGMGLLTPRGVPAWHPAPPALVAGARRAIDYCASVGADIVKLAIQFAVAQPVIATTLVSSANPENIRRNAGYVSEPMDPELLARVMELLRPIHNHNFTRGRPENRDPIIG
jgi:L-galactose dehydrogenase